MKNIKELNKHLFEQYEKIINGEISPKQSEAGSRAADVILRSIRTEVIGAEHQGRIAKLDFLKE